MRQPATYRTGRPFYKVSIHDVDSGQDVLAALQGQHGRLTDRWRPRPGLRLPRPPPAGPSSLGGGGVPGRRGRPQHHDFTGRNGACDGDVMNVGGRARASLSSGTHSVVATPENRAVDRGSRRVLSAAA